jgi:hypothetical protein
MRTYPDPLFASNAAGRLLSRFGALSHIVSVSSSEANLNLFEILMGGGEKRQEYEDFARRYDQGPPWER